MEGSSGAPPETPPSSPTTPRSPTSRKSPDDQLFKSSLRVLLNNQTKELAKSIEYKEKLEVEENGSPPQEETDKGERDEDKKKSKDKDSVDDDTAKKVDKKKNAAQDNKKKSPKQQWIKKKKEEEVREKGDRGDTKKEEGKALKDDSRKSRTMDNKDKEKTRIRNTENEEKGGENKEIDEDENERDGKENTENKRDEIKTKEKEEMKEDLEENKKTDDKLKSKDKEKEEKAKCDSPETKEKLEDGERGDRQKTESKPVKEEEKNGKSQGFLLLKKKGPFSSWKRYYFVLDGQLLTYYRPEQDFGGHLSVLKGSLDLAMLEEVRSKKPGLMKTHFPFRLTRRNLPSLKLAADSREERDRWMGLIRDILIRSNRLSAHNSDKTLHTGRPFASIDASDQPAKFATMPVRSVYSDAHLSSSDEDEEPKLIKPKKIMKVPIAGPLAGINIAQVSLKKVEAPKKTSEAADDTDSSTSDQSDEEPHSVGDRKTPAGVPMGAVKLKKVVREKETGDPENDKTQEPLSAGEMFGVKLKKIQTKDAKKDEETKEDVWVQQRRVVKQANIPLNSGVWLGHPEVKPRKTSPINQKRGTIERKKSPSPNIPLSKSVHSLTKAAEAPSRQSAASDQEEDEEVDKNITIHHAESIEIRCSDEVLSMDPEVVTEIAFVKEGSLSRATREEEVRIEDGKEESPGQHCNMLSSESPSSVEESPTVLPRVSITVKEHSDEEPEYENLDEEFLRTMREFSEFTSSMQETESANQEENDYEELDEDFLKKVKDIPLVSPASKDVSPELPPSSPRSAVTITTPPPTPQDDREDEYEEISEEFMSTLKKAASSSPKQPPTNSPSETLRAPRDTAAEKGITPPSSPMRGRANTNESTASSCKSDAEGGEKKSSKFKFFRSRRSGSISSADKKESEEIKDPKEHRRGSITFSKILHGKKSRDKKKKDTKAVERPSETDSEPSRASKHEQEIPVFDETEAPQGPIQCADLDATNTGPEVVLTGTEEEEESNSIRLEDLSPCRQESLDPLVVLMRHNVERSGEEARCSTYSRTSNSSRDQEPAPSIPEKTRVRAKSPGHDIPQSNRPVTTLYHVVSPQEQEVEDRKPVDGYITEKQIQAILNACETRDRRRLSQSHAQGSALALPEGSDDRMHQRPSLVSVNSTESDEPLRATNFLSGNRLSTGSGSLRGLSKSYDSDSSGDLQQASRDLENAPQEQEAPGVHLRTTPRLADSLAEGNRVSLTSPEFTVVEEEGPGTPDATKTTFPAPEPTGKPRFSVGSEDEEEEGDYFPVVGGDVELRASPRNLPLPTSEEMRTSGIVELKGLPEEHGARGRGDGSQVEYKSTRTQRRRPETKGDFRSTLA